MLLKLNEIELNFENSVDFNIDEYDQIDTDVKNEKLGYIVEDIKNSNAKLVRYLDRDFKTLRIQIILKVVVDGETIIDHLLEFLINKTAKDNEDYKKQTITIEQPRNILQGQNWGRKTQAKINPNEKREFTIYSRAKLSK